MLGFTFQKKYSVDTILALFAERGFGDGIMPILTAIGHVRMAHVHQKHRSDAWIAKTISALKIKETVSLTFTRRQNTGDRKL